MTTNFADLQPASEPLGTASDFVNEFMDAVKPKHLFDNFSEPEAALLSNYLEVYGLPRQAAVLRAGDEGQFMAFLVTGSAVIERQMDGKTLHSTIHPGDILGELSFIDGKARIATCTTLEPSDFAVLSMDSFNALLVDHPRLGNKLMLMLLSSATAKLRQVATSPNMAALTSLV
ncbi:cyclic nucleotide-binding domain-containing protein [Curvibacter sp. CHRR-16]|uniref:cyclic nucleotide-binding domain-containing protein n=1 Tax=Curvibacter sp. CHRR-16 TaxID=2835872 RepID=UPI001BDA7540|nr:cyclic nucleotide-binding domain-containing protein [Curvibacter sp. CHRR-16]MBT0571537.1 cyclic nucleotide-binding domain-containing protein [Curvibacter sp. CHRR-16]